MASSLPWEEEELGLSFESGSIEDDDDEGEGEEELVLSFESGSIEDDDDDDEGEGEGDDLFLFFFLLELLLPCLESC